MGWISKSKLQATKLQLTALKEDLQLLTTKTTIQARLLSTKDVRIADLKSAATVAASESKNREAEFAAKAQASLKSELDERAEKVLLIKKFTEYKAIHQETLRALATSEAELAARLSDCERLEATLSSIEEQHSKELSAKVRELAELVASREAFEKACKGRVEILERHIESKRLAAVPAPRTDPTYGAHSTGEWDGES